MMTKMMKLMMAALLVPLFRIHAEDPQDVSRRLMRNYKLAVFFYLATKVAFPF